MDEVNAVFVPKIDAQKFGNNHGLCGFNGNILCKESHCDRCGWNPAVSEDRKKKIRKEMGL